MSLACFLSSRLDYLLISQHLMNELCKCAISQGLYSDHDIRAPYLGDYNKARCKGLWDLYDTLLHDLNYVNNIKDSTSKEQSHAMRNV